MRGVLCCIKNILPVFLLVLILQPAARGAEIVVVQSARLPAYDSVLQGLTVVLSREIPSRGQKAIQAHGITSHVLTEVDGQVLLRQRIVREQPDLLVAIGSSSLALVKDLTEIPVIYLMVPFPEAMGKNRHVTGINMNISAARQLEALARTAPGVGSIGLLYDPERTDALVKEARDYAARNRLNLVVQPVRKADEVPGQLAGLKGRIDWFWMVPDLTVLTPQTVDYILLFSLENRVPVFTFANKYLGMGAVLSVSFDPYDMGEQAGELALKILNRTGDADLPPAEGVRKVVVESNAKAAQMLGIVLKEGREEKR